MILKVMSVKINKKFILSVLIAFCIVFAAGILYVFNEIFPKAKPMELPKKEDIISFCLSCSTKDAEIKMSEECYEELIKYTEEAKPTRRQSLNDNPTVKPYYGVAVKTAEAEYSFFVYEEGTQIYIERPYEGIHKADEELLNLVLQYFQEG